MDFVRAAGDIRAELEGSCRLQVAHATTSGFFHVIQQTNGSIFAGVRTLDRSPLPPGVQVIFEGHASSSDRGRVRAHGTVLFSSYRKFNEILETTDVGIAVTALRVAKRETSALDVLSDSASLRGGRAPLFNFFGEELGFHLSGAEFRMSRLPSWPGAKEAFIRFGGLFQTHDLEFCGSEGHVSDGFAILTDAMLVMTLSTGAAVFYPEFTSVDEEGDLCRYFSRPVTIRPKMRDALGVTSEIDLEAVAGAFSDLTLEARKSVRRYILQLADASDETTFLETRALAAVGLIERILNDRVERGIAGFSVTDARKLRSGVMDYLKQAPVLAGKDEGIHSAIRRNVRDSMARVGERGFRTRLLEYCTQEEIGTDARRQTIVASAAKSRNLLVHESRFDDDEPHIDQYCRLRWIATAMLLRALGVRDGFRREPAPVDGVPA